MSDAPRRVAVIGAEGQLGSDVSLVFAGAGDVVIALNHGDLEIADAPAVTRTLAEAAPDVIVNTAAAHNVDTCETDPRWAFEVNGIGARNLARAAEARGAILIHISTDYVFDGTAGRPYREDDTPRPLNAYGVTKLAGEHFVASHCTRHMIVRTSGLYGRAQCRAKAGLNFVRLMLKLARERGSVRVVADQVVTPTYTLDLARQIRVLSEGSDYGIVHTTAQGECSWYEFARAIFDLASVDVALTAASASDFPSAVRRPAYSVLDNARLRAAGLDVMSDWKDALARYLSEIGELRPASMANA